MTVRAIGAPRVGSPVSCSLRQLVLDARRKWTMCPRTVRRLEAAEISTDCPAASAPITISPPQAVP